MASAVIETEIKYLKGIGPKRAQLLEKELGIRTYGDLIAHYPTSYLDRTSYYNISNFGGEMPYVQVKGRFITFNTQGEGAKTRLVGLFTDGTRTMECVWFNRIRQIKEAYHTGVEYIVFGKPTEFCGHWSMVHPEVDTQGSLMATCGLRGVYPLTDRLRTNGIGSRQLHQWIQLALSVISPSIHETLPPQLLSRLKLCSLREATENIHNPLSTERLNAARFRLKFDELLYLQLNIQQYARRRKANSGGFRFPRIGEYFNRFYNDQLPFELTGAQKRVIKEIRADMNTGKQMNRLVQGDVGSGKTLVALMCMLIAIDNGHQACLMAPTEILAGQHFETLSELVAPLGINVKLLTGSTGAAQRRLIHSQLADGSLHILVGTHALVEDNVQFRSLGLAVIDEQHRFGVAQRARLWRKNTTLPPHVLVMTATPIPRTLAMTIYGDLDVSVIDELPPGRKPVVTLMRYDEKRMEVYRAIGKQLREGRQVYIVYPLIKENEKNDLKSLEEGFEQIKEIFHGYKVAMVHGQMKPAEKDWQMELFASHKADILVATTVIEVGVNVPNATTMVIENAERFGLSQLHQLRGRVGRGGTQIYCVLMSKMKIASQTRKRLEIMTSTTDGFVVAEADLKMRGPGDIEGTMQSGLPVDLKIASLTTDSQIVELARNAAIDILDDDPDLSKPQNRMLSHEFTARYNRSIDWSRIS